MKEVEVMKVGTFTDSAGRKHVFTRERLDQIAASYDPGFHEAPHVVGHPKDNAPAYGWVKALRRDGDSLIAGGDLQPEFEEMVKRGLFKKRSASFYNDLGGKGFYLRHVAWLGAQPPAVKGLKDAAFAEGDEVVIEFGEGPRPWLFRSIANVLRGLREWIIEEKGVEVADKHIPAYNIDDVSAEAERLAAAEQQTPGFQEKPGNDNPTKGQEDEEVQISEFKEKVKARLKAWGGKRNLPSTDQKELEAALEEPGVTMFNEADIEAAREQARKDARREADEENARKNRKAEIAQFVEGLKRDGKVTPALESAGLIEFMAGLDAGEAIQFAEKGDKVSQLDWFKKLLQGAGRSITFGEVAPDKDDPGDVGDQAARDRLIAEFREQNKDVSYKDAVLAVSEQHPELFAQDRR